MAEDDEQVKKRLRMVELNNCPICHSNFPNGLARMWKVDEEKILDLCVGHMTKLMVYLKRLERGEEHD